MKLEFVINEKNEVLHRINGVEHGRIRFTSFEYAWRHVARYAKPGALDRWFKMMKS